MYYAIHFENVDSATLAAKTVLVIDSLDLNVFDVSTFKYTAASWGQNVVTLNELEGSTEIDLRPDVPNILRIMTNFDEGTGIASWLFETLDTLSMIPTEDIDQGFLPPNVNAPEGIGFVAFEINLLEDVESDTVIENDAQIYFDFNDPIVTNTWVNIFDNEVPQSHVNDITDYVNGETVVNVTWETDFTDPNILYYNIYNNTDGSSNWTPWMAQTTESTADFTGEVGMTYHFMSVSVDSAFNVEEYADEYDDFVFIEPVGVDEIRQNQAFKLFPNPATDRVVVSVEGKYFDSITLTDMTGRLVLIEYVERGSKQYVLELRDVSSGIYNVTLLNDNDKTVGRSTLVVQ
ncbi:MAG: hypothetical protein ACI8XB_001825 [Patiriisocius sp.]|jgi:hypothetical protein